jgi:hypothetical protein
MSSLIIGEAEETTYKKAIVTASLTPKYFLICESCFWCASSYAFLNEEHNIPKSMLHDTIITRYARCPACRAEKSVESLPISSDESYKFDYDPIRGVILEFLRQSL